MKLKKNPFQSLVENLPEDNASDEDLLNATITANNIRELRNLQTYYNPDPLQYVDTLQHAAILATFSNPPEVALQATIYDGNPDPKIFQEAKQSQD
jgi:hypothetical protein